jgi:hypothetical protein
MTTDPGEGSAACNTILHEPEQAEITQPLPTARHPDANLEATELTRIRGNYTRASSLRTPRLVVPPVSKETPPLLARVRHAISSFWKNQISVTVGHNACRDHLGMYCIYFLFLWTQTFCMCLLHGVFIDRCRVHSLSDGARLPRGIETAASPSIQSYALPFLRVTDGGRCVITRLESWEHQDYFTLNELQLVHPNCSVLVVSSSLHPPHVTKLN